MVWCLQVARLREACYQLFGYRVDMASQASKAANPPTVVTLKPRYAGQGAELIFQWVEGGPLELLESTYTAQKDVAQQIAVYLGRCGLASVKVLLHRMAWHSCTCPAVVRNAQRKA